MDQQQIQDVLADLHLGAVRFFAQVGSTNDEAARWVMEEAPDMSLVVADEQTAGRGRDGRTWYTPRGSALAFSLVIYPTEKVSHIQSRLTALGALAVQHALQKHYHVPAQIKWPNDVLVHRKKLAGVLAEAHWSGDQLKALVLGIGINVAPESVAFTAGREDGLNFPATCLQAVAGQPVDRLTLLHQVIEELVFWRPRLGLPEFLQAWEANLAFRGEMVQLAISQSAGKDGLPRSLEGHPPAIEEGMILGLSPDGSLRLRKPNGEIVNVHYGEMRLRPLQNA